MRRAAAGMDPVRAAYLAAVSARFRWLRRTDKRVADVEPFDDVSTAELFRTYREKLDRYRSMLVRSGTASTAKLRAVDTAARRALRKLLRANCAGCVTIEKGREGDDGFDGGGMHVAACEDCRVCGVHHGTGTAGCSKCGVPAGGDR